MFRGLVKPDGYPDREKHETDNPELPIFKYSRTTSNPRR
jgi:hypothetical protein